MRPFWDHAGMAHSTENPLAAEQLALLSPDDLPYQFRLDQRTRQRGLAHVAAIRAQLAEKAAARHTDGASAPARRAA